MNRSLLFVLVITAVFLGVLGGGWVKQPPSNQEMLANVAKALDYAAAWKSGPGWWTPNFLHGTSLAPLLDQLGTTVWLLFWVKIGGLFVGPKLGGLVCIFFAALGLYYWVRRLTDDGWTGAAAALALLFNASIYVRLGGFEHYVFVTSFAVAPWMLLGATELVYQPSRLNGLLFALGFSLLTITYAKAAAMFLPLVLLYGVFLWAWKQRTWRLPWVPMGFALGFIMLLAVALLLPSIREVKFATMFQLAPFEAWKQAFSLKSNLLWLDRGNFLSRGMAAGFNPTTAAGGNYVGLIAIAAFALIFLWRSEGLYQSIQGFICRLMLGLFLVAHWLSFGDSSILAGQLRFLNLSVNAGDYVPALSWLLFCLQPWLIYRLLPRLMPGRHWIAGILSVIYLLVPGYRLISWFPLYADLRAPHDFSQTVGIFFLAAAVGCAFVLCFRSLPDTFPRRVGIAWLIALATLDISPYLRPFFHGPMGGSVFADFLKAESFLASAPRAGWVEAFSGRYFYLLTPHLARRGLATEAFHSFFMQRGMRFLEGGSFFSPELTQAYLNVSGIAYILIDKTDPDTSPESNQSLKSMLAKAYENDNFLVLENANALAPAFLARNFITGEPELGRAAYAGLSLANLGILVLPQVAEPWPAGVDNVGTLTDEGYNLRDTNSVREPFQAVALTAPRLSDFQKIEVAPVSAPGWIVIPEAYHPDWKAFSGQAELPVKHGDAALISVLAGATGQAVTLRFVPPWWYNGTFYLSTLGWLAAALLALVGLTPVGPDGLRSWLRRNLKHQGIEPETVTVSRRPIKRAVVVIPTYNEAQNLPRLLEKAFAADPRVEALIVDDNSPDGTRDVVRAHPEFGRRLHLLARPGKMGLGSAYKDGFAWAFEQGFEACLEMDADLSHDPADISRLLAEVDAGADAAIGSRYLGGVRVMNWPEHRLLLSTGASRYVRAVTGLPLTDATSGFKALRVSMLRQLDWNLFRAEGYGFQVELHYHLWRLGARLVEVPIVFTERRDGQTKMSLGIAIEAAYRTAQLPMLYRLRRKPTRHHE